ARIEVYEVMNRLKKEGVAIIMISSELPEVIGMSDRIMVMRDGKFTGKINRQDATEEKLLSYAVSRK
ncbi:MAG TPA: D-xylose ABC transporter ATP-binding protein, partial [Fusobacteriaceae bacterium]|nr:D-xylose ABC transporter ATP-binding protein [Fusobacteriaceae bacterium]